MNPRDRRALIWGGVVVGAAIIGLRGLPWLVQSARSLRETAISRQATLDRARSLLANRDAVRDSLGRALGAIVALAPQFVEGRSSAEAQASLAGLISLAASRHSLRLVRIDPLPDSTLGLFNRVSLHAELEGDVSGLSRLLRAVEIASPVLTVTGLGVLAPDPVGGVGRAEQLRIEMNVAGYYVPRGAK